MSSATLHELMTQIRQSISQSHLMPDSSPAINPNRFRLRLITAASGCPQLRPRRCSGSRFQRRSSGLPPLAGRRSRISSKGTANDLGRSKAASHKDLPQTLRAPSTVDPRSTTAQFCLPRLLCRPSQLATPWANLVESALDAFFPIGKSHKPLHEPSFSRPRMS